MPDETADRIRKLILAGDNRLKQGGAGREERARDAYERALELARAAGVEARYEPLLRRRLDDIDRLRGGDGLDSAL